jgi:hypothetical protein
MTSVVRLHGILTVAKTSKLVKVNFTGKEAVIVKENTLKQRLKILQKKEAQWPLEILLTHLSKTP